ncbi:hypothetical protein ScPMuIL_014262 [Solemya velum]
MLTIEKVSLMLIIPANVLYTLAAVTHAWFELPGVFYGLWWAEFCDILSCQIIPAFFTEEPAWYHLLQITSLWHEIINFVLEEEQEAQSLLSPK